MLGSSSCSLHQQQQQTQEPHSPEVAAGELQLHHHQIPPSIYLHRLLLTCAHSISQSDFTTAHRITTILSANSSPSGDSSERLIHSFTKALSLRLRRHLSPHNNLNLQYQNNENESWKQPLAKIQHSSVHHAEASCYEFSRQDDDEILKESYFLLNQITPFIRFSHLTANQAILEAIYQKQENNNNNPHDIHILDFDIMQGFQWPPLMQAITDRNPQPTLRITATGTNLNTLRTTGDRLSKFANSLGLTFRFFTILLPNNNNVVDVINHLSAVVLLPNETLAVNCVLYLHRLLPNRDKLCLFLKNIKSMNPKVVTLAETEANHNYPVFVTRFNEAMDYYTAVFESFEATMPSNSRERAEVEQVWFGREIADIVAAEGDDRRERHERFLSWEMMMRIAGFRNVPLSPFALTQAKLLLRLHYPCEGYNVEVVNDSFFLGWKNKPLFSVSSWN